MKQSSTWARIGVRTALGASLFVGSGSFAAASEDIVVHVSDYAGVSREALQHAENEASRIYRAAGIAIIWGSREIAEAADRVPRLQVVILNREMADRKIAADQIGDTVLAQAAEAAERAYIFYDRVIALSDTHARPFWLVLGRVMAHEIGHILLPLHSHSAYGVMRGVLDMSSAVPQFSREQISTMRATIGRSLERKP